MVVDVRLKFSLQDFGVLCIILSEFPTKNVLECEENPTYFIGCCDCTSVQTFFEDYFMFSTNIEYIPQDSIL